MSARFLMIWIASAAVLSDAASSRAADFVDIVGARPCSSIVYDRVGASGNCKTLNGPKGLSVVLEAKAGSIEFALPANTKFADATPSSVTVDGLMLYNGSLAPEVMRVNAGDRLDIKLVNKLPSGERGSTNLHTHGLLVSPHLEIGNDRRAVEPVGDSVFVCTVPEGEKSDGPSAQHCKEHGAIYGKSFSEMNYRLALRRDHPEGLFWYHPHVHMNARTQVGAGMAGLIYINGPDAAISGGARLAANQEPPFERLMMLKDIQFGEINASDASALKATFLPADAHSAGLCGDRDQGAVPPNGVCFGKTEDGKDVGWLFTVNGQVFPRIDVAAGRQEAWRIANSSADMTYDLALVEAGTGRPLRFQILARDGVAAATQGGESLFAERVLLMPGSRIEVGISRQSAEGLVDDSHPLEARLRSYGFFTGHDAGFGDAWPAVDLAQVVFRQAAPAVQAVQSAPAGSTAQRAALRQLDSKAAAPSLTVSAWKPNAAAAATDVPQDPMPSGAQSAGSMSHQHGGERRAATIAVATPCKPLRDDEERIVALAIDKTDSKDEKFKIGLDHARRDRPAQWSAAVQRAIDHAYRFGDTSAETVCTHAGNSEIWTIVNRRATTDGKPDGPASSIGNNETHNFHIHQLKFEVLDVVDPTGRIGRPLGGPKAKRMVDSYPVPIGGELRVRINFTKQQIGRFVFHCHILEHEDKGMMAAIEVRGR
jgi:FtsP/CotA-like multicopper oxidase with cupredoxin domain